MTDLISRADAIEAVCKECPWQHYEQKCDFHKCVFKNALKALPSADRPTEILDDRTLVVKVPNAKEVGRVLVQDADKNVHIGGGFYYHEDSADIPPMVRCKDCRHANKSMFCSVYLQSRLPSDFCSFGERKEE